MHVQGVRIVVICPYSILNNLATTQPIGDSPILGGVQGKGGKRYCPLLWRLVLQNPLNISLQHYAAVLRLSYNGRDGTEVPVLAVSDDPFMSALQNQ